MTYQLTDPIQKSQGAILVITLITLSIFLVLAMLSAKLVNHGQQSTVALHQNFLFDKTLQSLAQQEKMAIISALNANIAPANYTIYTLNSALGCELALEQLHFWQRADIPWHTLNVKTQATLLSLDKACYSDYHVPNAQIFWLAIKYQHEMTELYLLPLYITTHQSSVPNWSMSRHHHQQDASGIAPNVAFAQMLYSTQLSREPVWIAHNAIAHPMVDAIRCPSHLPCRQPAIFIYDAITGNVKHEIRLQHPLITSYLHESNGLGALTAQYDSQGQLTHVIAGDSHGYLWRIPLQAVSQTVETITPQLIANLHHTAVKPTSIISAPLLVDNRYYPAHIVVLTGDAIAQKDFHDQQSIYVLNYPDAPTFDVLDKTQLSAYHYATTHSISMSLEETQLDTFQVKNPDRGWYMDFNHSVIDQTYPVNQLLLPNGKIAIQTQTVNAAQQVMAKRLLLISLIPETKEKYAYNMPIGLPTELDLQKGDAAESLVSCTAKELLNINQWLGIACQTQPELLKWQMSW